MRKREFEVFGNELLDVWALDVGRLLNLDNLEDLVAARLVKGFRANVERERFEGLCVRCQRR